MDNEREKDLIRRCLNGDRQALAALIEAHQKPVYNTVYRMLGNPETAADVTQTAFLKAFENLGSFDPTYRVFSWLYRIAINESIDQIKHMRRLEPIPASLPTESAGPAAEAERIETGEQVQAALLELGEEQRAVIALRYFSGLRYDDIAIVLDVPAKTVKSRLYTARQRLREQLERQGILGS